MPRASSAFICQSCGASYVKWSGRCEACGNWNTLIEERTDVPPGGHRHTSGVSAQIIEFSHLNAGTNTPVRIKSGIEELDRVFGGGAIPSSAVLVGGDPGIGKSTLLLQAAAKFACSGANTIYISGEEAASQIQDRARRLGVNDTPVQLAAETNIRSIMGAIKSGSPDFLIVDSIQTLWSDSIDAAPGSVTQVRACSQELVRFAKSSNCCVILVGHVTKEGQIAGPRVIEHMVDAVLYFEGERTHQFRILRAVKNRFGPVDEIGIFEMREHGLAEAREPSAIFLNSDNEDASGATIFAAMEGTRPVLAEVQALASVSAYGTPRRSVVGWDNNRLAMVLAVLEARCSLGLGTRDIYLNVAGGYRISEPAGDLAAAASLVSSFQDISIPRKSIWFGEIALSGAIRPVNRMETRLREAERLGFENAFVPTGTEGIASAMNIRPLKGLPDLLTLLT